MKKMIEIVAKFILNMIFGEEKRVKIKNIIKLSHMSWILPIWLRLVFHEMPNSCIFKKPSIWQVFWYITWYGKHIRIKYRWRQVLWADALIQMPRKTPERKPMETVQNKKVKFGPLSIGKNVPDRSWCCNGTLRSDPAKGSPPQFRMTFMEDCFGKKRTTWLRTCVYEVYE